MTNKEAFKEELSLFRKYAYEFGQSDDIETYELMMKCQVNLHTLYEAAIAYMQEQSKSSEQSEPVATIYRGIAYWIGKEPPEGTNLFTTPQRQQPLKRLSDEKILEIAYKVHEGISPHTDTMDFANAIMDEIERINK